MARSKKVDKEWIVKIEDLGKNNEILYGIARHSNEDFFNWDIENDVQIYLNEKDRDINFALLTSTPYEV